MATYRVLKEFVWTVDLEANSREEAERMVEDLAADAPKLLSEARCRTTIQLVETEENPLDRR